VFNNSCIFPILSILNKMETDSTIYDNKAKISKIMLLELSPCLRVCKAGEVEFMTSELSLGVVRKT
jgi:hypothetical protein